MTSNNESTTIYIESWFIPIDILMLLSTAFAVLLATIYLIIIKFDRTCHSVSMMLIANSCLSELAFGCVMFGLTLFTFQNDLNRIQYYDALCVFRGYTAYVVTFLQNYSYLLQAIYRYIIIRYPTRFIWQSMRFQLSLISLIWITGFICPLPFIIANRIVYNVDNQICQIPFEYSIFMLYNGLFIYAIPISLIIFIYIKLVRCVREMSKHVITSNSLLRAQRELKMVYHLVILVSGIITIGFPYTLLVFISFFTTPPKYHFRIAYIFVNISLSFVTIAILQFTEPLKISLMKRLKWKKNTVLPIGM